MQKNIFGKIITRYRQKYDLQKKVICKGICSEATYLRTEKESRAVDYAVLEALLARLGQDAANFEIVLADDDFDLWTKRMAIRSAMAGKQLDVARKKLRAYRCENANKHKLHEQFCLYYEMKLAGERGEGAERICRLAEKALAFTKAPGELPEVKNCLYTPMELELLLTLVQHQHQDWKNPWKREGCLLKMLEYVEVYFDPKLRKETAGQIWMELLKLEEAHGGEEKLLACIDRGIACFAAGNGILRLAEAHFMKAKLLLKISRSRENGEAESAQCREECRMAYAIYEVMEHEIQQREVEQFCERELQWHITMQIK